MPRYRATIITAADPRSAFDSLARFDRAEEWDPGVSEGEMLTAEPVGRGSRFRLVAGFLGRSAPLEYEIVEFDPPARLVLHAETRALTSTDTITFTPDGAGTRLVYDAVLGGTGLFRFADPLLALVLRRIGERAAAGLRTHLGAGTPR